MSVFQVYNKKSDYAAFARAFGLYNTVARAQLEIRSTRTLQRGGQKKGRSRIAQEPPIQRKLSPNLSQTVQKGTGLSLGQTLRLLIQNIFSFQKAWFPLSPYGKVNSI